MAKKAVFKPGRSTYQAFDPRALFVACLCSAMLRVATEVLFFKEPDLLASNWQNVVATAKTRTG